jgi:hypothetical protein
VLLRLDPDVAKGWSDDEVTRSWGRLVPLAINRVSRCLFPKIGFKSSSEMARG